jgi:hypothetical protein
MGAFAQVRRTTRPRKPVPDMFVISEPRLPRRKANPARTDVLAFPGMTALDLKTLTSSNTVKNQQYLVAKLETEVVRVDGARPESPGIKMRTISQKQMEEQGKRRQERAERRARRSEDGIFYPDGIHDSGDFSQLDVSEDIDENQDGQDELLRHRRGPGDEEDYETPDRSSKRLRFGEEEQGARGEQGERDKKRVKWDRGLSKTIFLDELRPGERARPVDVIKKGCLAPAAKVVFSLAYPFNC